MSAPEPKYPAEPLPHLLLPADYLHNPLFFDTEWADAPSHTLRARGAADAQLRSPSSCRGTPRGSPRQSRHHLYKELTFSLQDDSTLVDSPARAKDSAPRRTSPQRNAQPAPVTKTTRLREEYILQRELNKLREEEARRIEAAQPQPLPPPPRDDIDERILRPTRAAQLRWRYVAERQQEAEERESNIHFVKGKDTSRMSTPTAAGARQAASATRASRESVDTSVSSSGRLTKAAQLLREHTLKRLQEAEDRKERQRVEEENLTFAPTLSRPRGDTGRSAAPTSRSSSSYPGMPTPSLSFLGAQGEPPRSTKAEDLRKQHVSERLAQLERDRAVEQAARDAILYGPGSSYRRTRERHDGSHPSVDPGAAATRKASPAKTAHHTGAAGHGIPRGAHKELVVTSVHPAEDGKNASAGLPKRRGERGQAAHHDPNSNPIPSMPPRQPSTSLSRSSSSIQFYVEVVPPSETAGVSEGRELDETVGGDGAEEQVAVRARDAPAPTAPSPESQATVVNLTPVADARPPSQATQRSPVVQDIPSLSSFSTIQTTTTATVADPALAQVELLRQLRAKSVATTSSLGGLSIRAPVLFTKTGDTALMEEGRGNCESPANGESDPAARRAAAGKEPSTVASAPPPPPPLPPPSTPPADASRRTTPAQLRYARQQSEDVPSSLTSLHEAFAVFHGPGRAPNAENALLFPRFEEAAGPNAAITAGGGGGDYKRVGRRCPPDRPSTQRSTTPPTSVMHHHNSSLLSRTPVDSVLVPELQESNNRHSFIDKSVTLHDCPAKGQSPSPTHPAHSSSALSVTAQDKGLLDSIVQSFVAAPVAEKAAPTLSGPATGAHLPTTSTPPARPDRLPHGRATDPPSGSALFPATPATRPDTSTSLRPTPLRDVGRREAVHGMRKVPNAYTAPPSDVKPGKETQTPAATSSAATWSAPPPLPSQPRPQGVSSFRKQAAPLAKVNSDEKPPAREVVQAPVPQGKGRTPVQQRSRLEHGVSIHPRGSPAKRVPPRPATSNGEPTRHRSPPHTSTAPVAEEEKVLTVKHSSVANGVASDAVSSPAQDKDPMGHQQQPQQGNAEAEVASRTSTTTPLLCSFAERNEEEKETEPRASDTSFAPQFDENLDDGKRLASVRDDGRPDSHAPTPVRHQESMIEAATQSSPPPRPAPRARSSSHTNTHNGDEAMDGTPTHFVLPELSAPRWGSESLPRPTPQCPPSAPQAEAGTEAALPPSSSSGSTSSSSFISNPLRDQIVIDLPEIQEEQTRIKTGSDEPLQPTPMWPQHQSAFSDTSSSFRDSSTDPDQHMEALRTNSSLSRSDRAATGEAPIVLPKQEEPVETLAIDAKGVEAGGVPKKAVISSDSSSSSSSRLATPLRGDAKQNAEADDPLTMAVAEAKQQASSHVGSVEDLGTSPIPGGSGNHEEGDVADQPLHLSERPSAPLPPMAPGVRSGSSSRNTAVVPWSAGSPTDFSTAGPSPILSEHGGGGAEDLLAAFNGADSSPHKPRYVHSDL